VAPELLGLPLAGPWRRLAAILADLLPVAILANAGLFVFLAFAGAIATWRSLTSRRNRRGSVLVRLFASLFVLVTVLRIGGVFERDDAPRDRAGRSDAADRAADGDEGDSLALSIARALAATGLNVEISGDESPPVDEADTAVVREFALAVVSDDSARIAELRPRAAAILSAERISSLENRVRELRTRNAELSSEVEKKERKGVTGWIAGISDDLGIGFGWGALYFTTLLVVGNGQTPGKRMFGVRVIRLDAKPIGWWLAFERFGSYFASFSTGLLGFAQIFWDRNRQALHDKAVETVVVRVRRGDRMIADRLNAARR